MSMPSFARGNAVDLDIYIYDYEGGSLVDPDGYAGGTEPTVKIYDQDGTLVHQETDNSNITRISTGHYRFQNYTIPVGATLGQNWRIVWAFNVNGNLLPAASRTEHFEVAAAGGVSFQPAYSDDDSTADLVEGLSASDIKQEWKNWANWVIDLECGHDFHSHSATEYHDIVDDQCRILLDHYPVLSVSSLQDNANGLGNADPVTITSDDYYLDADSGILTLVSDEQTEFTKGTANVAISYSYGYTSVPSEVQTMANLLVAFRGQIWLLEKDGSVPFGVERIQIGDFAQTFGDDLGPLQSKFGGEIADIKRHMKLLTRMYGKKVI